MSILAFWDISAWYLVGAGAWSASIYSFLVILFFTFFLLSRHRWWGVEFVPGFTSSLVPFRALFSCGYVHDVYEFHDERNSRLLFQNNILIPEFDVIDE